MAVDKARVGRIAMELMDDLERSYPEGEIEAVVVCAAVRRHPGAERRVAWVAEPADRELVKGTLYTAMGTVDTAPEDEGGGVAP
jgi:hypothetical protein